MILNHNKIHLFDNICSFYKSKWLFHSSHYTSESLWRRTLNQSYFACPENSRSVSEKSFDSNFFPLIMVFKNNIFFLPFLCGNIERNFVAWLQLNTFVC